MDRDELIIIQLPTCSAAVAGLADLGAGGQKTACPLTTLSTCTVFWRRTPPYRRTIADCWLNLCGALLKSSSGVTSTTLWYSSRCPHICDNILCYMFLIFLAVSFWRRTCYPTFCTSCVRRAEAPASCVCSCCRPSTFCSRISGMRRPCVCFRNN